VINVVKPSIII